MSELDIRRIVLTSSQGAGGDWARLNPLADKPVSGPLAAEAGTVKPGPRVNRADLAGFLLDAVEQGTWIREAPLVWNAKG
ncbi:hypothetical protein ACF1FE_27805 [Streptomyces griseofuscus]|uniref:hypothetical protein n=1 Tax=Streptomyces griseofuscus TaxID=146922 RepID=UPI0036F5DA20